MKTYYLEGDLTFKVGNNASENDQLLNEANQNDIWFHLDNMPSPHGILFTDDLDFSSITKKIYHECCEKIKENSKAKNIKKISVIYTPRKNIKKTDTLGKVILKKKTNKIVI